MPMKDVRPFVRAILDRPEDDAPRLVLADYLEELGSAQGEFIRAQCERVRLHPTNPRHAWLARREEELLRAHGRDWLRPMHALLGPARRFPGLPLQHAEFRRGLVEAIRVDAAAFVRHADDLMLLGPVREVCLVVMTEDRQKTSDLMKTLAGLSCWDRVEVLGLRLWAWTEAAVGQFLGKVDWPRLTRLHMYGHQIGPEVCRRLVRWPGLARLSRVEVRSASNEGAAVLNESKYRTLFGYPF
jgi:uncharacterized protein (TIGR02996 family)